MPERTDDELRLEIASERQALAHELDVLRGQVRSLVPVVIAGVTIAGVVAAGLLSRGKYLKWGAKLVWKLR